MNLQDFDSFLKIRQSYLDRSVESPRSQESRVQRFLEVSRSQHDDFVLGIEAIHIDKQLIESIFFFLV
jgi:hypothetical protein